MRCRVILVPFPFDDLTGTKVSPAVCLTGAFGVHRHVVLAFITSVVPPTPNLEVQVQQRPRTLFAL
jgi:mRNA interferase MazF